VIKLTLPFPPSINHAYGYAGKRKYLKKEGHAFRLATTEAAIEAQAKISGRLAIFIALYPPTKRKFDIDNRIKAVQDALQLAGVFLDDEQIDTIICVRRNVIKGGMCKVVLCANDSILQVYEAMGDIDGEC
jgi:crossover junction endodeoxyribonuclease RusA